MTRRASFRADKPLQRCAECGERAPSKPLQSFDAVALTDRGRTRTLVLCGWCLRDRGAAWRTRWRIRGRTLPEVAR